MKSFLLLVMNWSEVWAPLVPLAILFYKKRQPSYFRPVIIYLVVAVFINFFADIISMLYDALPKWINSNNVLYNFHSIFRFICFSYFFSLLPRKSFVWLKFLLPIISLLVIIINFCFVENFMNRSHLSGNLLALEAYLLLIYCMQYYLDKLKDDDPELTHSADFWIVTGLSIYVVINFFVFLFYVPMLIQDIALAINIWYVHNLAYIILCLFIARGFYVQSKTQLAVSVTR